MLYAVKANRQYPIDESEKEKYINLGYKIGSIEKGELVLEEVEAEDKKLVEKLETELKELKLENEKLKNELEAKKKENKTK